VIEAVAFSMLVERVAWNFKECSRQVTDCCVCLAWHGLFDGEECVAFSSSATRL
jgi:hypothetical protein